MSMVTAEEIKKVRETTGAGVIRVKEVLEEVAGDQAKAVEILRKEGFEKMEKRESRETGQGLVNAYTHHSGKVASLVELFCETDFVAKNKLFVELAHDLGLQVASMEPKDVDELLAQEFIKDPTKKISDLVNEVKAKTGENVRIGRIYRVELGSNR